MSNFGKQRMILAIVSFSTFVIGFVINLTSDTSLYNLDLNVIPSWQDESSLGSKSFIIFMNIVSNIFNPVVCAGYVALFWLISSKKLEVMVFLVWFIFLSWLLTILKLLIKQPRPYWIAGSGVQMLQWTCYSQFGCPSGHSMLGLVLMEFILRFFVRTYPKIKKFIVIFYLIVLVLQILVMFSRVILGMHTFNEVLMGLLIGIYAISLYYLYIQQLILCYLFILIKTAKKSVHIIIISSCIIGVYLLELLITYLPQFNNSEYFAVIESIEGCKNVKYFKSFQYKCLQDSALIMAAFGLMISLMFMSNPQNLTKPLAYTRLSCKYALKLVIMILLAAIPVVIFLNPGWQDINASASNMAIIIWACQNLAFFFAIIMLLLVAPVLCRKAGLQQYLPSQYLSLSDKENIQDNSYELPANQNCLM